MSLTIEQEQVLSLISGGSTITNAAHAAGVHRNTIYNWMTSDVPFRAALAAAREAKALEFREQAEALADDAIQTISELMMDREVPSSTRLKAAQSILTLAATPPPKPAPNFAQSQAEPVSLQSSDPARKPRTVRRAQPKIGRNELCPCGSGKKFKNCCLADQIPAASDPPAA